MSYSVVIRGALGVGKTTVASALADALSGYVVSIDSILEQHGLEEWEAGYISERSFIRANEIAVAEAEPILRRGTTVIFDGNFYHRSQIDDLAQRLEFPLAVFTLKAPLSECIERDRGRAVSYGEDAVREVFAKVAEVEYGIDLDARRRVPELIPAIVGHLRDLAKARPTVT
jgi:predicted kinase